MGLTSLVKCNVHLCKVQFKIEKGEMDNIYGKYVGV